MQKEVTKKDTGNIENNRFDIGNFEYNEGNDEFICPEQYFANSQSMTPKSN
jgi:transposase